MLYQNKENQIFQYTELDKMNGFIPNEMTKLTETQLKAYEDKPLAGTWNGNEWFANITECEAIRISQINNKTESIIVVPYPIYKQLNIRGLLNPFTHQDIEVMDMYIDSVRGIGKRAKEGTITVDEINWGGLDKYTSHDEIIKDATTIRNLELDNEI